MERNLSKVGWHTVKFPAFLQNTHNLLNKSLVTVPVLNQMDQIHILTPHFFKIHFNTLRMGDADLRF